MAAQKSDITLLNRGGVHYKDTHLNVVRGSLLAALDGSGLLPVGTVSQASAPANTSIFWIDESIDPETLKYHDGSSWVSATFNDVYPAPLSRLGVFSTGSGTAAHGTTTLLSTLSPVASKSNLGTSTLSGGVFTVGVGESGLWSLSLRFTSGGAVPNTMLSYMGIRGSISEDALNQCSVTTPAGRTASPCVSETIFLEEGDTVACYGRQYNGSSTTQSWSASFSAQRIFK